MRLSRLLPLVVFQILAFTGVAIADEWTHRWPVGGTPDLRVTCSDASVSVEVGSGNAVEALVKTRGIAISDAGVRIYEHQEGNRVELELRERSTSFSFGTRSVELHLRVPRSVTADLHTGDGSVKLSGLQGTLRVKTGDGSIQAQDVDGALDARSGDGSMHITGRFDNLQLRTNDGSVDVKANSGSRLTSDWRVETGDGSVHLDVPRDLAANVQLRTGDGSIHLDLPLAETTKNEHEVRGKLNGGGAFLDVRTGDGSVSLGAR